MISDMICENLLLRHSDSEKNQGSPCVDNELNTLFDLELRFDKRRWQRVYYDLKAGVPFPQHDANLFCRTDHRYRETLPCCTCYKIGRQITTCNNWKIATAEPGQATEHAAVTEHAPRPLVERLHPCGIFEQSDEVMHVRRYDISEPSVHFGENIASDFFQ
jgi:hypothetical protein